MKTASTTLVTSLKQEHALRADPEVTIEWNMNRMFSPKADNTPSDVDEGFHPDIFPVESIISPNRPTKGINKARVGHSTIGEDYRMSADGTSNGRFYIADSEDSYKYWTSPVKSDINGNITKVKPYVIYGENVSVNKIAITTENTWASAKTFSIQVTTNPTPADVVDATNWVEVANQTTMGSGWKASGKMVLYYNGNGTALTPWVTSGRQDNADKSPKKVAIRGVRIVVTALEGGYKVTPNNTLIQSVYRERISSGSYIEKTTTGKETFFDLIEIAALLELNATPYLIDISDEFDMGESSALYPIGTVTTNKANITLSNLYQVNGVWETGLFDANNAASPYHKLIEPNAIVNVKYNMYRPQDGTDSELALGAVQQIRMYVDSWSGQGTDSVSVELSDFSKFFNTNEVVLRPALWEGLTVPQIVWRILDSVGFTDYNIDYDADTNTDHVIPVFYTDGEKTVWETLDELAKAAQAAIYFDSYGKLQVKTRNFAFKSDPSVWHFKSYDDGLELADIAEASIETEFEPNTYKIIYQKTNWSDWNNGQPALQFVWEPEEETVALRATPLLSSMTTTSPYIVINPKDVVYWPYESIVNIEGELIRYKGKRFVYYTGPTGAVRNVAVVSSPDEYKNKNSMTDPLYRAKNGFTGELVVTERGVWNSYPEAHKVDASGYSVRKLMNNTTQKLDTYGFEHDKARSRARLTSGHKMNNQSDILVATRGSTDDTGFTHYGTKLRMIPDGNRPQQQIGLVIHSQGSQESGYYFELRPEATMTPAIRKTVDEFTFFSRVGGVNHILGRCPLPIVVGVDYELDVQVHNTSNGNHLVMAWVNGKMVMSTIVKPPHLISMQGRFGMFLRGKSRGDFEYLYAVNPKSEVLLPEDFSFPDKVDRGYTGNQWDRDWVFDWRNHRKRVRKKWNKGFRVNSKYFDEFGAIVHELREFDVKFDPKPVLHSRIFNTNDWASTVLEYNGNPFGAKFIIANTARYNSILRGEDKLSFPGTDEAVQQQLGVYGRCLVTEDAQEIVAKNDVQIMMRGKIESEISSPWIQSAGMAQELADWLTSKFSYGNENISVEVFGNPLIEVCDVVTVDYPDKFISGDWFVVGVQTQFKDGLKTTLQLRKRII